MRWYALALSLVACAPRPMAVAGPVAPVREVAPVATTGAAAPRVVRREQHVPRLGDATLVTEIEGGTCRYGVEVPIGPGMISLASGVWLVLPNDACEGAAPDVRRATDFIAWRPAGRMDSEKDPSPEHRAAALGAPLAFLATPKDAVEVPRRLLADLALAHPEILRSAEYRAAKQDLELYDDRGALIADPAALLALCDAGNAEACFRAADTGPAGQRHRLLSRACALGSRNACYQLGLELRTRALEALRRSKEVEEYRSFVCGVGARAGITPILANEAASCVRAPAVARSSSGRAFRDPAPRR
jgi:hypothetical protein